MMCSGFHTFLRVLGPMVNIIWPCQGLDPLSRGSGLPTDGSTTSHDSYDASDCPEESTGGAKGAGGAEGANPEKSIGGLAQGVRPGGGGCAGGARGGSCS